MKKKLDLNNLIAKYQGISSQGPSYNYQKPTKQSPIEQEFYQYKTYQHKEQHSPQISKARQMRQVSHTMKNFQGNFVMSKSQVQQFLVSIKQELQYEQRGMGFHTESAIKQLQQTFQRNHEKVKRQIVELLDRAFYENEKVIKQQLLKQSKIEPPEFSMVYRKITALDEQIGRLLAGLKGPQYKKTIATVVVRDFNLEIKQIQNSVEYAKTSYISSLGEIEPDRNRIEAIKDNLSKLFYFSKKANNTARQQMMQPQQQPEQAGIFSIFKDLTQANTNNNNSNHYRGYESQAPPSQAQSPQPARTRKSFFNFGFGNE